MQITNLTCGLIQTDQSHFNNFMARVCVNFSFFRSKCTVNAVRKSLHNIQKRMLSRPQIICDTGFNHMSGTV